VISVQAEGRNIVQVYPTATYDVVTIATEGTDEVTQVTVFDMLGKAVIAANALENNRFDLTALATGMYLMQWQVGGQTQTAKIVKK
jgi:hypothetical protein